MSWEMPAVFKILEEDTQYNEIQRRLLEETNISYPSKYRRIFGKSRTLLDKKLGPYSMIIKRDRYKDPQRWYETINGEVQEKFTSVYYHYSNIKRLEASTMEHCRSIIERMKQLNLDKPVTVAFFFRKFVCEYEAFVLQFGACFGHFIHSIAYYFGFFTYKKERLLNKLRELAAKNKKAEQVLKNFENNMPNFEIILSKSRRFPEGYSDRDKIAHAGQIFLNPVNIIFHPVKGATFLPVGKYNGSKAITHHPPLSKYLDSLMYGLFDFISDIYELVFSLD